MFFEREEFLMRKTFVLTDYIEHAMSLAAYEKLDDGSYAGRIPPCPGVIAFGPSRKDCEEELRSTLEDWILVGLKLKHQLPVIAEIDLNKEARLDQVGPL